MSINLPVNQINNVQKLAAREQKSTSQKISELITLGTANNWDVSPQIISICNDKKHTLTKEKIFSNLYKLTCQVCNYSYYIDSTD